MASAIKVSPGGDHPENKVDHRQQLFNDGLTGRAHEIQVPGERITRLLAYMYDFDTKLLIPDNPLFPPADDPRRFYDNIRPVLDRHPLARHGEVRSTGGGLHVIPRFEPPVELASAADQRKWGTLIRAVQFSLPGDPNAPAITGLTRAPGSVNSKNGATVEVIRPGKLIDPKEVEEFVKQLAKNAFRTVATILLGDERVVPCPVCRLEGTRLDILDDIGMCYVHCGTVTLAQLFDCIFKPFASAKKTEAKGASKPASPRRRGKAEAIQTKSSRE